MVQLPMLVSFPNSNSLNSSFFFLWMFFWGISVFVWDKFLQLGEGKKRWEKYKGYFFCFGKIGCKSPHHEENHIRSAYLVFNKLPNYRRNSKVFCSPLWPCPLGHDHQHTYFTNLKLKKKNDSPSSVCFFFSFFKFGCRWVGIIPKGLSQFGYSLERKVKVYRNCAIFLVTC